MSSTSENVPTVEAVAAPVVENKTSKKRAAPNKKSKAQKAENNAGSDSVSSSSTNAPKQKKNKKNNVVASTNEAADVVGNSETFEEGGDSKRKVLPPQTRLDIAIKGLQNKGATKEVKMQLIRLRGQLNGAKIRQKSASRPPNRYNMWMKEQMAKLKENGMAPKDRFAYCISLWNAEKEASNKTETETENQ